MRCISSSLLLQQGLKNRRDRQHLAMADMTALKQADMENWLKKRHKALPTAISKAQRGDLERAFLLMTADSTADSTSQKICKALIVHTHKDSEAGLNWTQALMDLF